MTPIIIYLGCIVGGIGAVVMLITWLDPLDLGD